MMEAAVLETGSVQLLQQARGQGETKLGSVAAAVGLTQAICSALLAAADAAAATIIGREV